MYQFLESNKLIPVNLVFELTTQLSMTESIKSFLDNGDFEAGIFIFLEKAFDTVNHQILCNKLNYYTLFFYKNLFYKNHRGSISQILRIS